MNRKGFTLVELLATVVILSLVMAIGTYSVMNYIDLARANAKKLLASNIRTGSQLYIDECTSGVSVLKCNLKTTKEANATVYTIDTQIATLVTYNFLNVVTGGSDNNRNTAYNEKQQNIGSCPLNITKRVSSDYKVSYSVTVGKVTNVECPSL